MTADAIIKGFETHDARLIRTGAQALGGLLVCAALVLSACSAVPEPAPRNPVNLTLVGDDSMQWLGTALADAYTQQHPYATMRVEPANSAYGLSAVSQISGTIGMGPTA